MVSFQVGYHDASILKEVLSGEITEEDLMNLRKYNIYIKELIDGMPSPVFSAGTFPPNPKNDRMFQQRYEKILRASREKYTSNRKTVEAKIAQTKGVIAYSAVLEENVMLDYNNKQDIARIKGVSEGFDITSSIDSVIVNGEFTLKNNGVNFAVLGYGLASRLGIYINNVKPIKILAPKRDVKPSLTNLNALNIKQIYPIGVFSVLQEGYDSELIIVPLDFCRKLLEYKDEISAVEIKLADNIDKNQVQEQLKTTLGKSFAVKNRYEQHELLFKIMESEKWVVFSILTFVIIIASFNLTGSLTMLIIDKKDDIVTLQNLGANNKLIKKIFLLEGWMISISGAIIGLLLGSFVCWLQIQYGLVGDPNNILLAKYPVELQFLDFVYTFLTVILIGFVASWYPVRHIAKKHLLI